MAITIGKNLGKLQGKVEMRGAGKTMSKGILSLADQIKHQFTIAPPFWRCNSKMVSFCFDAEDGSS